MSEIVTKWLAQLGLGQYAAAFAEGEIGHDLLADLDHETLIALGVSVPGHRLRILKAAKLLASDEDGRQTDDDPAADQQPEQSDSADGPARAERRQLTVMFCDLVGSTDLSGRLDPEDLRDVIRQYQTAVEQVIERFDGHVAQYLGDGLLIYFGYPSAHEDDAQRAVSAAIEIPIAMTGLNSRLEPRLSVQLAVRIGIHTGPVVVGEVGGAHRHENLALGETPNIAARLQSLAAAGEVVISDQTRALLNDLFNLKSRGRQTLKGVADAVPVYSVGDARVVETRFLARQTDDLAPMVGRANELKLLLNLWHQAIAGEGQLVLLTGEAGIGKSRITQAMIDALANERHVRISYQCSPYHSDTALYPAIQQLQWAAGIKAAESGEAKFEKLEALLRRTGAGTAAAAPLIAELLSINAPAGSSNDTPELTPQQKRARTLQALVDQLIGLSLSNPILFILEDAHWIDPTTLELIEQSLGSVQSHRVMMLVTARPTFDHRFGGHTIVSRIALNRLGKDPVDEIVKRITHGKSLPGNILEQINAKTDGVPLFVEEVTKAILESGALREVNGSYVSDGSEELAIPSSLHDSLMARLDRHQRLKAVAQTAACIGREFDYGLLAAVTDRIAGQLTGLLDQLVAAELIFQRGRPPEASYTFKHALVRDAAYESLLKARRVAIHASLLDALQSQGMGAPAMLAHHAECSNQTLPAVEYRLLAGNQAMARPAFQEAISHFEQAVAGARKLRREIHLDARLLESLLKLAQASAAGLGLGHTKTVKAFEEANQLLDTTKETPHRFAVLYGTCVMNVTLGDHKRALRNATKILDSGIQDNDPLLQHIGFRLQGMSETYMGRLGQANKHYEMSLALCDSERDANSAIRFGNDFECGLYVFWAIQSLLAGEWNRSKQLAQLAETRARQLQHPFTMSMTLNNLTQINLLARAPNAKRFGLEVLEHARQHEMGTWRSTSLAIYGAILNEKNEHESAVECLGEAIQLKRASGTDIGLPWNYAVYSSSLAAIRKEIDARHTEATARSMIKNGSEQFLTPESIRILANANYYYRSNASAAIPELLRAIEIAQHQGAWLLHAKAALSLAQIWTAEGEEWRCADILRPLVVGFPAGGRQLADYLDAEAFLQTCEGNDARPH